MLALAFVRCPHAHADVGAIDVTAAGALPGVAAVLTAVRPRTSSRWRPG